MADRNASIIISLRNQASPEIQKIAGDYRAFINQLQAGGASIQQAERQMLSLAQAKARTLTASGQAAKGEQELTAALGLLTTRSTAAFNAQTQLVNIQNRLNPATNQAKSGVNGLGQALGALKPLIGSLGVGFGVQQLVAFGKAAGEEALHLRETKNSLRAVAGDARTYTEAISIARQQQLLFGGSLRDNIDGLQGLTVTARQSGASIAALVDLSQRLNVLSPEQGVQGARIALAEALSGNVTSLSRRFEIPKSALKGLTDESLSVSERLKVLDEFLNKVGVTSAAVAGKVDQDALAFRRLGQELGDLKLNAGDQLATAFSGAATGLARLVGLINNNPQAIAELRSLFNGSGGVVQQSDIDKASEEIARRKATATLFSGEGGPKSQGRADLSKQLGGSEGILRVEEALTRLNLAGDEAAASGARLTAAFKDGQIPLVSYLAGLDALVARENGAIEPEERRVQILNGIAAAQQEALTRLQQLSSETDKSAQASVLDAAKKDAQQAATALLAAQSKAAVNAFLALNPNIDASGVAALLAAKKIDEQTAALAVLRLQANAATGALAGLVAQQAAVANVKNLLGRAGVPEKGQVGGAIGGLGAGAGSSSSRQVLDDAVRLRQSQFQLRLAQATTAAQRIAILKEELSLTNDQVTKNGILAQIASEQNSGARSHTSELNQQLGLEERIRDSKEKQLAATLDASAAIIRDRQQRREEDQALKLADKRLANPRLSADQRAAIEDTRDLILIAQQQRQLQIQEQLATAGGQVINGRILQSRPTGQVPTVPTAGALAQVPQIGVPGSTGGLPQIEVLVTLDGKQIAANVVTRLRGGLSGAASAGAGV